MTIFSFQLWWFCQKRGSKKPYYIWPAFIRISRFHSQTIEFQHCFPSRKGQTQGSLRANEYGGRTSFGHCRHCMVFLKGEDPHLGLLLKRNAVATAIQLLPKVTLLVDRQWPIAGCLGHSISHHFDKSLDASRSCVSRPLFPTKLPCQLSKHR